MPPQLEMRVVAYLPAWRVAVALLHGASLASIPLIFSRVLLATDPPVTPLMLHRMVVLLTIIPWVAARLLRSLFTAALRVEGDALVLLHRKLRMEIPYGAIERIDVWSLPLPGPGFTLRLRSGRRLRYRFQCADPLPLLEDLSRACEVADAKRAASHPIAVWAHAKLGAGAPSLPMLAVKFALFALLPAGVLFNAHQHIAYGGLLGQYYMEGIGPYVQTAATYWSTMTIYLVLYAGVWRGLAEAVALAAAAGAPDRAAVARRGVELACTVLYYGGVPLLLALRFAS